MKSLLTAASRLLAPFILTHKLVSAQSPLALYINPTVSYNALHQTKKKKKRLWLDVVKLPRKKALFTIRNRLQL